VTVGGRAVLVVWAALVAGAGSASAQALHYEPIRVDVGLVGGYAGGVGGGGFGGVVEPKFLVRDDLAVGLRVEGMVIFGASVDGPEESLSISSGSLASTLLKAEYLVGDLGIRPMVGLGLGIFSIGGQDIGTSTAGTRVDQNLGRHLGMAPQVGLELGRVRLAVAYNVILGADIEVEQTVGGSTTVRDFTQNYYSFELSLHFGGSRLAPSAAQPSAR